MKHDPRVIEAGKIGHGTEHPRIASPPGKPQQPSWKAGRTVEIHPARYLLSILPKIKEALRKAGRIP